MIAADKIRWAAAVLLQLQGYFLITDGEWMLYWLKLAMFFDEIVLVYQIHVSLIAVTL